MAMQVRFWGVRGSVACPGPATMRYGGNTSCVEVRCGGRIVVLDAGSGLRPLGAALAAEAKASGHPVEADLLLTHTHLDHVWGLPFFQPAYVRGTRLRLWAGHLAPAYALAEVIGRLTSEPLFPGGGDLFQADMAFTDFRAGETLTPQPGLLVRTAPLRHPDGGTGYRLEHAGAAVAYVTDTEHRPGFLDEAILDLVRDVDLMIYDSTYTDAEFPARAGRGHSTWQEGVRIAQACGVGQLAIFHHDPGRDDDALDRIAAEAAEARPGTIVAAEGTILRLATACA